MTPTSHSKLIAFIWSIADDCLRDVYVRGKYRDVILPMVVLRRLDTLLEDSKEKVLDEVDFQQRVMKFTELESAGLTQASGYVFYNTSKWTLRRLHDTAANSQQILQQNFEEYLNGFSANVQEIIDKFELKAKIRHMAVKNVLLGVLEKFVSPYINLTLHAKPDPDGYQLPPLTNLGMGYVFEELIRKFNEENNEEAGEHFTPREVIQLMTHLLFDPLKAKLPPVITIYDPACGSGGMLTEAQNFITDPEGGIQAKGDVYLYGKEINDETYAICKSDMMIKGNDPANIKSGSTLATDEFLGTRFDFMLSNPPYGKSWKSDKPHIVDGNEIIDRRFTFPITNYWGDNGMNQKVPDVDDGQLLFLMEMISKMKAASANGIGSRIASIHNGSSLFTGSAGTGMSNIRRHIIENDILEAIIQLPNNLFYNTGITTYIWVLANNKPTQRSGKVQLIEASQLFRKLRKNLGEKNCEFAPEHIEQIVQTYLTCSEHERPAGADGIAAQVFDNADFGYYKISIERPDRRCAQFSAERIASLRFDKVLKEPMAWAYQQWGDDIYTPGVLKQHEPSILRWCEANEIALSAKNRAKLLSPATWSKHADLLAAATTLMAEIGNEIFTDFNAFKQRVAQALKARKIRLGASEHRAILGAVSWYDASAEKVIKSRLKLQGAELDSLLAKLDCTPAELPDFGYYPTDTAHQYLTFEPASDLRDSESVPLKDSIHSYFQREVQPHVPEAWIDIDSVKIGYEISFNKYFYRHQPLRSVEVVAAEILELERQSEGLIAQILDMKND